MQNKYDGLADFNNDRMLCYRVNNPEKHKEQIEDWGLQTDFIPDKNWKKDVDIKTRRPNMK